MAETGRAGGLQPPGGPSRRELEERWKDAVDVLTERPRDAELLVKAGQLSEQLDRRAEAYTYFHKALTLDPSKAFLVAKLRGLAVSPQQKDEVTQISRRPASFEAGLPGIFTYPLRGKGLAILVMGALLLWVGRALFKYGIGGSGLTIAGLVAAYMAMFYIDVCHSTVGGDDVLPEWPDPLRLHEFGLDVGKFVCAMICSFLPVVLILIALGSSLGGEDERDLAMERQVAPAAQTTPTASEDDDDEPVRTTAPAPAPSRSEAPQMSKVAAKVLLALIAIGVFALLGLVYLPMATLANVVMGSPFTCFNFPFVFRSIGAAPRNYMICLACYFGVCLVAAGVEFLVNVSGVLVFTGFALAFLELYGMTMLMRLLGLFYRMNQARLGWMAD
jgi:hypothetical protein